MFAINKSKNVQFKINYYGKVIVIDANFKSGTIGEMHLWQNGVFVRGNLSGEELLLNRRENN